MNRLTFIQKATQLSEKSVKNTLKLLDDDATVPFISRYRKELTAGLDEVSIGAILRYKQEFEDLEKRKSTILKAIKEQGGLTNDLEQKILNCTALIKLEDLYLPFKKKRKTKASIAKEFGLEPLAKIIMRQQRDEIVNLAHQFINGPVKTADKALYESKEAGRNCLCYYDLTNTKQERAFKVE